MIASSWLRALLRLFVIFIADIMKVAQCTRMAGLNFWA